MFNDFDTTNTYKTIENLKLAISKISGLPYDENGSLIVQVPTGKNAGRFTAIFPYRGGHNVPWIHRGFKVMG